MEFDAVRAKINETIAAEMAIKHPGVPVAFENTKFATPKTAWVYVTIIPNDSRKAGVGDPTFFHEGVINVHCMVPEDTGTKLMNDIATSVFEILADRNFTLDANGYLTTYGVMRRVRGNVNGFYTMNVMAEYCHQAQLQR